MQGEELWRVIYTEGQVPAQPGPGFVLKSRGCRLSVIVVHSVQEGDRKVSLIWLMFIQYCLQKNLRYFLVPASPYFRIFFWNQDSVPLQNLTSL